MMKRYSILRKKPAFLAGFYFQFNDSHDDFKNITGKNDISIDWISNNGRIGAKIYLFSKLWAILIEGEKPGNSLLAKKNSPLAKILEA